MNNFGFLVETIKPLPSKGNSFGKPVGRIPYMTKKDIIANFRKKNIPKSEFGKKKKLTPKQRSDLLKKVMKIKKDKNVTLKEAWKLSRN
jgi:hypothetical protein